MSRSSRCVVLRSIAALLVVALVAPAAVAQPRNCSIPAQNLFVRDVLQQFYYWYQFLPDPDPARFDSPEAYLEAVRYRPLDESFSYIASKAATDAFYSDSQFIGFGLSTHVSLTEDGLGIEMRVSQVFPESPASEAGLARGDRILAVGGRTPTDWWLAGLLGDMFGPADVGFETGLAFQRGDGTVVEALMIKRLVTIPTVSTTQVYEVDGRKVGYVFFRNFVRPSVEALDIAFAQLKEAGVQELVLDLRYNGGGLVSVAQHLASLIGGTRTAGQVLGEYVHNDKNAFRNQTLRFEEKTNALTLERLVVIATRGSASASELVINGLRPFVPVMVIGEATYGKPVGQYGIDMCDKTAFPVAFSIKNANGEGDYFGGIPATCPAADDLDHQLGDRAEGSLAEALAFIQSGACSTEAAVSARRLRAGRVTPREHGFRQLIGAY
jgi:C-terminal peptidase prc